MSSKKHQSTIESNNTFMVKMEDLVKEIIIQNDIPYYRIESRVDHNPNEQEGENKYLPVVRVITYFEDSVTRISDILKAEFEVAPAPAKDKKRSGEDNFSYKHINLMVNLKSSRQDLIEYRRAGNKKFEIQVCSMLQDAWAGIEKELGYGSGAFPEEMKRDFYRVGALLEMADLEFLKIRKLLGEVNNTAAAEPAKQAPSPAKAKDTPVVAEAPKAAPKSADTKAPKATPVAESNSAPAAPVAMPQQPAYPQQMQQPMYPQQMGNYPPQYYMPNGYPQPYNPNYPMPYNNGYVDQNGQPYNMQQQYAPYPQPNGMPVGNGMPPQFPVNNIPQQPFVPQPVAEEPVEDVAPEQEIVSAAADIPAVTTLDRMDMNILRPDALSLNVNNVDEVNGVPGSSLPQMANQPEAEALDQDPGANTAGPAAAGGPADAVALNIDKVETFNMNVNGMIERRTEVVVDRDKKDENDKNVPFYEQEAKPVKSGVVDENAQMNDASLKEYVTNSKLVKEVDSEIARRAGATLNNDVDVEGDVERLRYLKVYSLKQLHERIMDNKNDVIAFAEKWIGKDNGGSFDSGICLFYLEYLLVGKRNDPAFAVEYVLKFISDNDYSARFIIPTYNAISKNDQPIASHLTIR